MVYAHGLVLRRAVRRHMNCCTKSWRTSLRGVRARSSRWITQDTLSNLLLCRYSHIAILSRWSCLLDIARSVWSRVGGLVLTRRTDASLCWPALDLLLKGSLLRRRGVGDIGLLDLEYVLAAGVRLGEGCSRVILWSQRHLIYSIVKSVGA